MAGVAVRRGRWASLSRGKRIGVVVAVLSLALTLAAVVALIALQPNLPTPQALTTKARAQAALTGGAQVYVTHCAYCHDKGFGPSVAGRNLPLDSVRGFVRTGPGGMPAFPISQLSDADVKAVTDYINGLPLDTEDTQ